MHLVKVLKALADETRLRIINLLSKDKLCVCELEYLLNIAQSNVSRHLDKLKTAGIIDFTKKSQWCFYYLNKDILLKYPFLEELIYQKLHKEKKHQNDLDKLKRYRLQGTGCEELRPLLRERNK